MAKKQNLNFWEVKDNLNFPIIVCSVFEHSDTYIASLAEAHNLVAKGCQVRAITLNEVKMYDQSRFVYSLDVQVKAIKDL